MRIHYVQHDHYEAPGIILSWAAEKGHDLSKTLMQDSKFRAAVFPGQHSFDWLIILGGSMSVYEEDRLPWLRAEKDFILKTVESGKTVLGICLGAQLLADTLGGAVTKNPHREIGWFPLSFYDEFHSHPLFDFLPENPVSLQWHGDTFSVLPPGARPLAESKACRNQGFIYRDRVFAFQFHWECTQEDLTRFIEASGDDLAPGPFVQSPAEILGRPEQVRENNVWMKEFLSRLEARSLHDKTHLSK
jgi:GMP synthase-like glutamine amidotransferase